MMRAMRAMRASYINMGSRGLVDARTMRARCAHPNAPGDRKRPAYQLPRRLTYPGSGHGNFSHAPKAPERRFSTK